MSNQILRESSRKLKQAHKLAQEAIERLSHHPLPKEEIDNEPSKSPAAP